MTDYRGRITRMSGMDAYRIYQTVRLHFTSPKFDMFRTPLIKSINPDKFYARSDHRIFESWAAEIENRQRWGMLLVSNFAYGNPDVVYGNRALARKLETQWKGRQSSLGYVIDTDCNKLQPKPLQELLTCETSRIPGLMTEYIGSDITLETLVAFNSRLNLIKTWTEKKSIMSTMLQPEFLRVDRVSRFINYNTPPINHRLDRFLSRESPG